MCSCFIFCAYVNVVLRDEKLPVWYLNMTCRYMHYFSCRFIRPCHVLILCVACDDGVSSGKKQQNQPGKSTGPSVSRSLAWIAKASSWCLCGNHRGHLSRNLRRWQYFINFCFFSNFQPTNPLIWKSYPLGSSMVSFRMFSVRLLELQRHRSQIDVLMIFLSGKTQGIRFLWLNYWFQNIGWEMPLGIFDIFQVPGNRCCWQLRTLFFEVKVPCLRL